MKPNEEIDDDYEFTDDDINLSDCDYIKEIERMSSDWSSGRGFI